MRPCIKYAGYFDKLFKLFFLNTNYFLRRETSGFVEGLNNKIKVIKRRCYGIYDICRLFQHIWLDAEGRRLFGYA